MSRLHQSVFSSVISLMIIEKAITSHCVAPSHVKGIAAGHPKPAADDDALCIGTGL